MRRLLAVCFFIAFLVVVAIGGSHVFLQRWANQSIQLTQDVEVELERGMGLDKLSRELQSKGAIDQSFVFKMWVRRFGNYAKFQSGRYKFSGRITPRMVAEKMQKGDVYTPVVAKLTIPEGFTIKQTAARMAANGIGTEATNLALLKNQSFLRTLNIPSKSAEGYIYPAAYEFSYVPEAKEFITKAVKNFWEKLPPDYMDTLKEKKISLNTAVTIASLIELETAVPDERFMISEVIWRRIAKNDFLGIDAAVIYGIENYQGDIKASHLKDKKNPYNLRVHRGMPPTPIGSVSRESLEAVVNPTNFGNYFYVAKPDGSGNHHFSKTLAEHNRHVKQLVRAIKENQVRQ